MQLKKAVNKLHLWLGLTSGLVVFIVAVTGCIYAFQEEIKDLTQPYRYTEMRQKPMLLPSDLQRAAEAALPGKTAHSVIYNKPGRSAVVIFYSSDPSYYYHVYLNPYTGKSLKVKDMNTDFFHLVLLGHFYLWLPRDIGQPVVATATLLFVVLIISGIILWWPKRNNLKQRFTIKQNVKWRRRNYDLHSVLGFYVSFFALLLSLTGLVWGFKWFAGAVYWTASGGRQLKSYAPVFSDSTQRKTTPFAATDKIYDKMIREFPQAASLEIHFPENANEAIAVNWNPDEGLYWKRDFLYFDQYSLSEISVSHLYGRFKDATAADKLLRLNYDIHVGAILGLPGKILAFLASLIISTMPVTGLVIWWGRKNKKYRPIVKDIQPENQLYHEYA